MTQKEKAKAYDEALEIARQYYNDKAMPIGTNFKLERMFPVLKETRDEKIKKDIIYVLSNTDLSSVDTKFSDMLAWINKEQKPRTEEEMETIIEAAEYLEKYATNYVRGAYSKQYVFDVATRLKSLIP